MELTGREDAAVPEILRARVDRSRDAVFLQHHDAEWSYGAAWDEIAGFARFLAQLGLDPARDRVATYLSNHPAFLWAWFGSLLAGLVFAPVHREHRGALLKDMLARSRARVLVTEQAALAELDLSDTPIEHVVVIDLDDAPQDAGVRWRDWAATRGAPQVEFPTSAPTDLAAILFTSGTTGRSKAAMIPHNQYVRGGAAVAAAMRIGPEDCFHAWPPLSHVGGQLDLVMAALIGGGRVALIERFSASRFWDEIARCRATLFIGFTTLLEILMKRPADARDAQSGLRAGLIGFVPPDLRDPFEERFGVRLFDVYGMTEAEPIALPDADDRAPAGSCGRVNPDFELAILDESGQPVATGQIGEIAARARRAGVMFAGYEDDEEATREAFRGGWFHTGDFGLVDTDGYVFFKDRKKQMIRRRGENISSWELEMAIGRHPDIEACAALGVPSPLGEEDVKVVVALKPGRSLAPAELHAWCQTEMARFMVPRFIEFVDALPVTDIGKVRKELLRSTTGETVFDAEAASPRAVEPKTLTPQEAIGRELQRFEVAVERGQLRLFAKAIGETDPIFFDAAAARAAGHADIVAPPTFLYCLSEDVPDPNAAMTILGLDVSKGFHAEQSIALSRPFCAGEALSGVTVFADYFEKKGGALKFLKTETVFVDQEGAEVGRLVTTIVVQEAAPDV